MGYSWNPLLFDMRWLRLAHYEPHLDGFFLHENITEVIGGNHIGLANRSSPIYTKFAQPVVQELFTPPYSDPNVHDHEFEFDGRTGKYVATLLSIPVALGALLFIGTIAVKQIHRASPGTQSHLKPRRAWRPSTFSPGFLIFLNAIPLILIALILLLEYISETPDDFAEHWSGGLDSDGVWTGERWAPNSRFIRAPTLSLPPRGLVSLYQDQGPAGLVSQKNATQRIGEGNYWVLTYLPTLVAVLYGRLWKTLDDDVKRIDKYIRLRLPAGEKAKDSIFLEYHELWVPLCIIQAARRGHWRVAISSLGLTLGAIVTPIVQNYVFTWTLYSGGHLAWSNTYSWLAALVDPWWSKVLVGVLATTFLCSFSLLILLPRCDTGLLENPQGLSSVVELCQRGPWVFQKGSNKQTATELMKDLGDNYVRLVNQPGAPALATLDRPRVDDTVVLELIPLTPPSPPPQRRPRLTRNTTTSSIISYLKPTLTRTRTTLRPLSHTINKYLTDYPLTFAFRPEILTLWFLLLTALLSLTALIANGLERNARDQLWNYTIPLAPSVYLILAIFIQSIADVFDYAIRALHPFYTLRKGARSAAVLFEDYTISYSHSVIPLFDLYHAFREGHSMICFTILTSIAAAAVSVFLGSLQLSSAYYGATTFASDQVVGR
ncbi:hypothetical protein B0T16DRAFT_414458 [Cercophora newfieldiana]|uniref:Uncharacterized protein n=1 Tax=Cercophora newfieldiana TaxID=92897 RepID=A0AA39Y6F4_9PEZI|nr:hypothetical protein B0T16DRAFT_414458 [Cercophora newfieldiana]